MLKDIQTRHPFTLETVDIHALGQEKWKKRYVYDIPVLHLDKKTIARGRWDKNDVEGAIAAWKQTPTG